MAKASLLRCDKCERWEIETPVLEWQAQTSDGRHWHGALCDDCWADWAVSSKGEPGKTPSVRTRGAPKDPGQVVPWQDIVWE